MVPTKCKNVRGGRPVLCLGKNMLRKITLQHVTLHGHLKSAIGESSLDES
jgi:hypothetical protein